MLVRPLRRPGHVVMCVAVTGRHSCACARARAPSKAPSVAMRLLLQVTRLTRGFCVLPVLQAGWPRRSCESCADAHRAAPATRMSVGTRAATGAQLRAPLVLGTRAEEDTAAVSALRGAFASTSRTRVSRRFRSPRSR